MKKLIAFHIVLLFFSVDLAAQQQDSLAVDSTQTIPSDSLNAQQIDSAEIGIVVPWKQGKLIGSQQITSDSLMRWQIWPNWGEYQAYRKEVISFRQGTSGRVDAFHINGYLPYEQTVRMEGIKLNNPVTGLVNYNLVPHRKIQDAREQQFGSYHSEINLKNYYITAPVSYLNYDESKYSYRNLEFMVTQNFTERTNLELSYWDRRDGDYYPNNELEGSQIMGRLYHHLNTNFQIRAMYLRNQFKTDEPFGYVVNNPLAFSFDRYSSQPRSTAGQSDFTRWDLIAGIYHRDDTLSVEDTGLETFISKNKDHLTYSRDTLNTDITSFGGRIFRKQQTGPVNLEMELEGILHSAGNQSPLIKKKWGEVNASVDASLLIKKPFNLFGAADVLSRTQESGYEFGGGLKGDLSALLRYRFGIFTYSKMPEIQAMYWDSEEYRGGHFGNEKGKSLSGTIEADLWNTIQVGFTGRFKSAKNPTFLSADSSFTSGGNYKLYTGTVYGAFTNHLFEIKSSGTYQQYNYAGRFDDTAALNNLDQILWIRNSLFVKGYVFDRASYLKMGLKTLFSPLSYSSRTYNTALGYWQGNSTYQQLPAFFRMDAEISARVRAIMVVIRWENVLDGLGQAGYFETAGFPMPPRRLIIGIRARFIN